jgi:hypothetical protein
MYVWLMLGLSIFCLGGMPGSSSAQTRNGSFFGAMGESLTGDVYAEPSRWRELSLGTLFSEGWDEAWVSPPAGEGGAPRQGWLNSFDGVFYRLGIATFGFADNFNHNGNQYTGTATEYLPFNRRLELKIDAPFVVSNKFAGDHYHTSYGDLQFTPRLLLSETRNFTQSFEVSLRAPTGWDKNGQGVAAVTPTYEFWANVWRGLVLRGGLAGFIPYGGQSINDVGARTTFLANMAVGYYFTPHDSTPFGDLVFHVSPNLALPTDNRGPNITTVSLTPGFRTHLGENWYLLGGVEVPVTHPQPFNYQVLTGLMKVC